MLKKIALVILALAVIVLIYAATRPDTFRVERTARIAAPAGGATYAWEGNDKAGAGRMEIAESTPSSKIAIKLEFIKPFEVRNMAEFTLQPQGGATQVTWAMHGPSPYIAKLMDIFFNMDQMIGKDFETGLANLKTASEK
jgi:hypothetical protein